MIKSYHGLTKWSKFTWSVLNCSGVAYTWQSDPSFGKIGRFAPENVTLQLIQSKCITALLYGLEACSLNKADLNSLDFVVNRFFTKLFCTGNINIVRECQILLHFSYPANYLKNGRKNSYMTMINLLPHWFILMFIVVNDIAKILFRLCYSVVIVWCCTVHG